NEFGSPAFPYSHHYGTLNLGPTSPFPEPAVNLRQGEGLTFHLVEDLGGILHHADDMDKAHKRANDRGKGKPRVHEEVFCRNEKGQGSPYHGDYQISRFGEGFCAPPGATRPPVHLLSDSLNPVLLLPRTQQSVIHRHKACAVGPSEGEHSESVEVPTAAMIVDSGKKLDPSGATPVIQGRVHYHDLLSLLIRQRPE